MKDKNDERKCNNKDKDESEKNSINNYLECIPQIIVQEQGLADKQGRRSSPYKEGDSNYRLRPWRAALDHKKSLDLDSFLEEREEATSVIGIPKTSPISTDDGSRSSLSEMSSMSRSRREIREELWSCFYEFKEAPLLPSMSKVDDDEDSGTSAQTKESILNDVGPDAADLSPDAADLIASASVEEFEESSFSGLIPKTKKIENKECLEFFDLWSDIYKAGSVTNSPEEPPKVSFPDDQKNRNCPPLIPQKNRHYPPLVPHKNRSSQIHRNPPVKSFRSNRITI